MRFFASLTINIFPCPRVNIGPPVMQTASLPCIVGSYGFIYFIHCKPVIHASRQALLHNVLHSSSIPVEMDMRSEQKLTNSKVLGVVAVGHGGRRTTHLQLWLDTRRNNGTSRSRSSGHDASCSQAPPSETTPPCVWLSCHYAVWCSPIHRRYP